MSTENQNQDGGGDKVLKLYAKNLKTIVAIVGGEKNLRPAKVKKDVFATIVQDLFKEDAEEVEAKAKESLRTLLKARVQMQREIDAKKKELATLEIAKMKEFNEAAVKLFNQVNGLNELESEYYAALSDAANAESNLEETKEEGTK